MAATITSVTSLNADGTYKIGDIITIAVIFTEAVFLSTGTTVLQLETGTTDRTANYLAGSGSSTLYFSYTVQAGDLTADLNYTNTSALSLNGDLIQDVGFLDAVLTLPALGSPGSLASAKAIVIDGVRPTATIVVADTALSAGETSSLTITFSEAVTGFTPADLTVANGTTAGLSSSDGGITWRAILFPTAGVEDASNLITLDATGVTDLAGNTGTGTVDSNNYAIDTQRPTATIVVADTNLTAGETSLVTITFSEAVTGFTTADLTVANGTVSGLSSSDGGITWTATLTPTANVKDTSNLITLAMTGVADASGNTGTGSADSNNYAIDTQRPTATIVMADTNLTAGETSLVTITFSEAVTGFTTDDLTVANGTVSALSSSDGGITWTAQFKPKDNLVDPTNVITVMGSGITDAAGNEMFGSIDSANYQIDTRPTEGDDILRLDSADDVVDALGGNDQVFGSGGNDVLDGNRGNDLLKGEAGDDTLLGGTGRDWLNGGTGADLLNGGRGRNDKADYGDSTAGVSVDLRIMTAQLLAGGDAEGDTLIAIENLTGSGHADSLTGNAKANILQGGNGADTLVGLGGDDVLHGGNGADTLEGGAGHDRMFGGKGNDVFVITPPQPTAVGFDNDFIFDFEKGVDKLAITGKIFGAEFEGVTELTADQFVSNATGQAEDAQDRFVFDISNGRLYFDGDGAGNTFDPFLLATFKRTIPDLSHTDFIVL